MYIVPHPSCVRLFSVALDVWNAAHIKFSYFEKLLNQTGAAEAAAQANEASGGNKSSQSSAPFTPAVLSTCLDVLIATLKSGATPNQFVVTNAAKVQQLLAPCFSLVDNHAIQSKLKHFLSRLTKLYPPSNPPATFRESGFYQVRIGHVFCL